MKRTSDNKVQCALWIMEVLENKGFNARMAGGCVRDRCMGRLPQDYDIASTATPDQVTKIFTETGAKVIPTGIDHGTVTVLKNGVLYEITTLRHDVETDGRHAKVVFSDSFEEDAARRDFTINAMFEDRQGNIYDYYHGLDDIKNRVLRFVGDATERIQEDYLRILRFFRFWARFDFIPDEGALRVIAVERKGLERISKERITSEMLAILACRTPLAALTGMRSCEVFTTLFKCQIDLNAAVLAGCANLAAETCVLARLTNILHNGLIHADVDEYLGQHLRLSNLQKHRVTTLVQFDTKMKEISERSNARGLGILDGYEKFWRGQLLSDFIPALRVLSTNHEAISWLEQLEKSYNKLRIQPMPLKAIDLVDELGVKPSPLLGQLLEELKVRYRNLEWTTKPQAIALARTILKSHKVEP